MNERSARGREAFPPKCRDYSPSRSSFPRVALQDATLERKREREDISAVAVSSERTNRTVSLPADNDDAT